MTTERVKCGICGSMVLPATFDAFDGLCAQCIKIPPDKRNLAADVLSEKNPLQRAIGMYADLIDSLCSAIVDRDFGVITDPEITSARFYAFNSVNQLPEYHNEDEVGSEVVDRIEYFLFGITSECPLLYPIVTKLRSIAPTFNSIGRTVFFSSIGMSNAENAWFIRHLNDRPTFERYFTGSGITEEQVNIYNSYLKDLTPEAEQSASCNPLPAAELRRFFVS